MGRAMVGPRPGGTEANTHRDIGEADQVRCHPLLELLELGIQVFHSVHLLLGNQLLPRGATSVPKPAPGDCRSPTGRRERPAIAARPNPASGGLLWQTACPGGRSPMSHGAVSHTEVAEFEATIRSTSLFTCSRATRRPPVVRGPAATTGVDPGQRRGSPKSLAVL